MISFLINKKNKKAIESIKINDFIKYNYEIIIYETLNEIVFNKIKTKYFCIIKNHSYFNSVILDEIEFNEDDIILFPEIYETNKSYIYLNKDENFYLNEFFIYSSSFFIKLDFFNKKCKNINNFIIENKKQIKYYKNLDFLIFNNRGKNLNED